MLAEKLMDLLQPTVDELGFILWGIEVTGASNSMTICIYIDHEEGIGVDDCQQVSYAVSALLDVEDPIPGQYVLEVSSPGMNRRIFNVAQAASIEGFEVKVTLLNAVDNKRKFKGIIKSVADNEVTMMLDDDSVISFDFDLVEKMRVIPKF